MLDQTLTLPEDPEELRSFTARLLAEVKAQAILIEKLRHQLAGHRALPVRGLVRDDRAASTRLGDALNHTVVQWASSSLKVAGSDTMPPGVAMTTSLWICIVSSRALALVAAIGVRCCTGQVPTSSIAAELAAYPA